MLAASEALVLAFSSAANHVLSVAAFRTAIHRNRRELAGLPPAHRDGLIWHVVVSKRNLGKLANLPQFGGEDTGIITLREQFAD